MYFFLPPNLHPGSEWRHTHHEFRRDSCERMIPLPFSCANILHNFLLETQYIKQSKLHEGTWYSAIKIYVHLNQQLVSLFPTVWIV